MADEMIAYLIYGLVALVGFGIGSIFFLWQNPYWRIKTMRKYMKKNYVMFRFLTKNRRGFERIEILDVNDDIKFINKKAIICEKGRIWRTDATNILGKDDKDLLIAPGTNKNDGFDFYAQSVRDMLKMELDVPIIYVDEDNFKPIEPFVEGQAPASPISSSWLNTALNNAVNIEVAKKLANKEISIKDIAMIAGIAICAYLVYQMGGTLDTMTKKIEGVGSQVIALDDKVTSAFTTGAMNKSSVITYNQGR